MDSLSFQSGLNISMQSLKFYFRNDFMFIDIINGIFQFLK